MKYSKQRETILNDLRMRSDHPTADMVYDSVRLVLPNISLGTVYRNLSLLSETGMILRIQTGTGPDRFDGFVQPHSHFICKSCGRVFDMDYVPDKSIVTDALRHADGEIDEIEVHFFGRCNECISSVKKS